MKQKLIAVILSFSGLVGWGGIIVFALVATVLSVIDVDLNENDKLAITYIFYTLISSCLIAIFSGLSLKCNKCQKRLLPASSHQQNKNSWNTVLFGLISKKGIECPHCGIRNLQRKNRV